jgi:hypothetical protein
MAQAQYYITARRYYLNITVLSKLEEKLGLTTAILPREWLETRDSILEGKENAFVNDCLRGSHPKQVRQIFTIFFWINVALGITVIAVTDWSLLSSLLSTGAIGPRWLIAVILCVIWVMLSILVPRLRVFKTDKDPRQLS